MSNTDSPATPRLLFGGTKKETTMSNVDNESQTVNDQEAVQDAQVTETDTQVLALTPPAPQGDESNADSGSESHEEVQEVAEEAGVETTEDVGVTTVPAAGIDPAEDSVQQVAVQQLVDSDPDAVADQTTTELLTVDAPEGNEETVTSEASTEVAATEEVPTGEVSTENTTSENQNPDGTVPMTEAKTEEEAQALADSATETLHSSDESKLSIEELQSHQAEIAKRIKEKQDAQKASVMSQIKTVVTTFGIEVEELVTYLGGLPNKRKGVPAVQKYKDPASGATWSGRGKAPKWIAGQDKTKFLITA